MSTASSSSLARRVSRRPRLLAAMARGTESAVHIASGGCRRRQQVLGAVVELAIIAGLELAVGWLVFSLLASLFIV